MGKRKIDLSETLGATKETLGKATATIGKAKDTLGKAKDTAVAKVASTLDANGDGTIDIQDVIILAVKTPGVHISRDKFLRKELFKNYPPEVVDDAVARTPALAGIPAEEISKIADEVINFERVCVSGISTALGMPGGAAMAATIPADLAQYYGYTLRAIQKLLYLYGFPEIDSDEEGVSLDSETVNRIIICLGVMNGVAGANNAIKGLAKALAKGVEKKLLNTALTKGAFYPFLKSAMKWFGVKLTKEVLAKTVKSAIPVAGGIIGGGLTFVSFKPCCMRLKNALTDTLLSNPEHVSSTEENHIYSHIVDGTVYEAEYEDCEEGHSAEIAGDEKSDM